MVYQQSKIFSNTSLVDRFISARQMTDCGNSSFTFITSSCTPDKGIRASLRRYSIVCSQPVNYVSPDGVIGIVLIPIRQGGLCERDEVCVNGLGPGSARAQRRQWANCVKKSLFDETIYETSSDTSQDIQTVLDDRTSNAYMVMSDMGGSTAREVHTYDITSWVDGYVDPEGNVKENRCQDCMSLKTERFAKNTKALKAEATLLTGGVAAGILWLGFLSG